MKVVVPYKGYQLDVDTVSMTGYAKRNDGYKYILIVIDILSRYLWTVPLKTLTGKEMATALTTILPRKAERVRSDMGTEFANVWVDKALGMKDVRHFKTTNSTKANYAERVIRTLKTKMVKYMRYKNSHHWIDVLPAITRSYNNDYHRSIKTTPSQAWKSTPNPELWQRQYSPDREAPLPSRDNYRFKVGDAVRLTYNRAVFLRAYDEKWTEEIFYITSREMKQGLPLYTVKDFANDPVKGTFYSAELQRVDVDADKKYEIEKILKRRTYRGKKQCLVKWKSWASKFNTWLDASEVEHLA